MKHYILFILVTMLPALLLAQDSNNRLSLSNYEQKARQETAFQTQQLNLSRSQSDSLELLNMDFYRKVAVIDSVESEPKEKSKQLLTLRHLQDKKIRALLTPSQFEKYQENIARFKIRSQKRLDSLTQNSKFRTTKN